MSQFNHLYDTGRKNQKYIKLNKKFSYYEENKITEFRLKDVLYCHLCGVHVKSNMSVELTNIAKEAD